MAERPTPPVQIREYMFETFVLTSLVGLRPPVGFPINVMLTMAVGDAMYGYCPVGPGRPVGPVGPVPDVPPVSPVAPVSPLSPVGPVTPLPPVGPRKSASPEIP